ncbi:MAG: efflux RND transporter periplasmic adaptor subunit [Myxococcota bacterium]
MGIIPQRAGLLLVPLVWACGADDEIPAEPSRLVVTEAVVRDNAIDRLVILGDVEGEVEARVFSQVPELITVLHVEEGQMVEAGDPIASLDGDLVASDLAQAAAAVAAAEASRDGLVNDLQRTEGLVRSQAAASSQLERLEAQLRASEAQVNQLRAARRAAGARRSRALIRAPVSGFVTQLVVEEGDVAAPSVPLCTIVQMDNVRTVIRVIEPDYVRIRPEMPVTVTPPALPDVVRGGRIVQIAPVLDRLTRTATVEVEVSNPEHTIRPGMVAEVAIELRRREDVLLVPARAVMMTTETDVDRTARVFVRSGDRAERRGVTLGDRYGDRFEVVDGVSRGEEVVTEGQHLLRDGGRIRVRENARPQEDVRAQAG